MLIDRNFQNSFFSNSRYLRNCAYGENETKNVDWISRNVNVSKTSEHFLRTDN